MLDIRVQRLAKLLAHYSLDLRKGDRLAIQTQPLGAPLVLELMREALRAGAHPEYFITLPGAVEDVRLRFEDGVVVEANAAQGQAFLDKMLSLDEGARRLGEFAFGNNTNVDRCIKNTLFDEKMGGTVHLALGASIPQTGGVNESALHWDMVCDLRRGSEVRVDGELFAKDGQFVIS